MLASYMGWENDHSDAQPLDGVARKRICLSGTAGVIVVTLQASTLHQLLNCVASSVKTMMIQNKICKGIDSQVTPERMC